MNAHTEPLQLRLERTIRTTPERCFAAWTEPDQLRRWSAPEGLHVEGGTLDLRVGGRWSVVMVDPAGPRHEAFGTYLEVVPPRRLVYTHAWGRPGGGSPETTVTVEFVGEGDSTRVVLTQVGFDSAESRDGHVGGWSSALDQLENIFDREG
jgi:uncharacterized protein YndB with AHSA1/START domain